MITKFIIDNRLKLGQTEEVLNDLENWIGENSDDVNTVVMFAILVSNPPFVDTDSAIEALDSSIALGFKNTEIVVLKAMIEFLTFGEPSLESIELINGKLNKEIDNKRNIGILYYLKAKAYFDTDHQLYFDYLNKSIEQFPSSSRPFLSLAYYYRERNFNMKSLSCINYAIDNVTYIYKEEDLYYSADYDKYVDENILGVNVTKQNYENMLRFKKEL